jgi:large subunit ribosomal protein L15
MLKLNELKPADGSRQQGRRIGRGTGSGRGCTAGKGNNGHAARSGTGVKPYFEGGQTPLTRRLPKRGFRSQSKKRYQIVNLRDLAAVDAAGKEMTAEVLFEKGLVQDRTLPVKILGTGDVSKPFAVRADAFSKAAREKIEKVKGNVEVKGRG